MADIIQSQNLKDLCSVLVVLSSEAAKTFQGIVIFLIRTCRKFGRSC